MLDILIKRLRLLPTVKGEKQQEECWKWELGQLGVGIEYGIPTSTEVLDIIKEWRGATKNYVPLFSNFPNEYPNDGEYLVRRVLGYLGLDTFDRSKYGHNPITQFSDSHLYQRAIDKQRTRARDNGYEWITLTPIGESEVNSRLAEWVTSLLYSPTPIPDYLWVDIERVLSLFPSIEVDRIVVKESLVRYVSLQWDLGGSLKGLKTPTDILRLIAYRGGGDVSLAKPLKLKGMKYSKKLRLAILTILTNSPRLEEDLLSYKGLWKSLVKYLHPGDYVAKFPSVVTAFDNLLNGRIRSAEFKLLNGTLEEQREVAKVNPGLLVSLLTSVDGSLLEEVDPKKVDLPLLLRAFSRLGYTGQRTVIIKTGAPYNLPECGSDLYVRGKLKKLILRRLSGRKPEWEGKTIYLDGLDDILLPFSMRKVSEGYLNLARGSRVSLGEGEVIRLFLYWKQKEKRTDLDLSALYLDEEFTPKGRVSFSSYENDADIYHSGDIQEAPQGATEYMDISLSQRYRYIVPLVLTYHGESFTQLAECNVGWMMRTNADSRQFDPATLQERFLVSGDGKNWLPFFIDLKEREVIYADIYSKGHRNIEGNKHLSQLVSNLSRFRELRPTYGSYIRLLAEANGASVAPLEKDDTTDGDIVITKGDVIHLISHSIFF